MLHYSIVFHRLSPYPKWFLFSCLLKREVHCCMLSFMNQVFFVYLLSFFLHLYKENIMGNLWKKSSSEFWLMLVKQESPLRISSKVGSLCHRDHFVYAPSEWETTLHCNVVFHWLGAYAKRSLMSCCKNSFSIMVRNFVVLWVWNYTYCHEHF